MGKVRRSLGLDVFEILLSRPLPRNVQGQNVTAQLGSHLLQHWKRSDVRMRPAEPTAQASDQHRREDDRHRGIISPRSVSAWVGLASNPIIIAVHLGAVTRLASIDRCGARRASIVAAAPSIPGLRHSLPDQSGRNAQAPRRTRHAVAPVRRRRDRPDAQHRAERRSPGENDRHG